MLDSVQFIVIFQDSIKRQTIFGNTLYSIFARETLEKAI